MSTLKQTISKGITTINMKTNNFVEQNKSRTCISALEEEITNLKITIGETMYSNWKTGNKEVDEVQKYLEMIKEKEELIAKEQEKIREMELQEKQLLNGGNVANKNVIFCSMCGAQNMTGYKFCVK